MIIKDVPVRVRLALMMFLTYAVQGAFWPLLAVHLHALGIDGNARGWIFATMSVGSIAMPLGAGRVVDHHFSGQRLLGVISLVSALILLVMAAGLATSAGAMFLLFLIYWMTAAPSYSLAGAIALRHLPRPHEQFPGVRLWGTAGWMAAGWVVALAIWGSGSAGEGHRTYEAFWVASMLAVILAAYSATLPDTPPLATTDGQRDGGLLRDSWTLARRPGMAPFLIAALGVHITMPFVYQVLPTFLGNRGMSSSGISSAMTIGQCIEIPMLYLLPHLVRRWGTRATLAVGIGAWAVRFGTLAIDPPLWVALAGIALHGVGISCFTVAGQVYIDGQAPRDRRAGAQALYLVTTTGLGMFLGSLLAGALVDSYGRNDAPVFLIPCVLDAALILYVCAGFRPSSTTEDCAGASQAARLVREGDARGKDARPVGLVTESADG